MENRLADEHAVKWVPVQFREPGELKRCLFDKGNLQDAMLFSEIRDKFMRLPWQRKLSQAMLDDYLPRGDRAQVCLVLLAGEQHTTPFRK